MKKLFIVGNWKSYKTQADTIDWIKAVKESTYTDTEIQNKEVIVCPQFPLLSLMYDFISDSAANEKLLLRLGAQDVSPFDEGAHTGEVSAKLLQEFCAYSIVGHSERRSQLGETDELVYKKIVQLLNNSVTPILCVADVNQFTVINDFFKKDGDKYSAKNLLVAYEPVSAIGTGNPDTPENAEAAAKSIKEQGAPFVLYGGSVKPDNIHSFTSMEHIDGVLVGGASLDPEKFIGIIKNA